MLIDLVADRLKNSGAVAGFWDKLDAGADATCGVASSARALFVAARFAAAPQPTLVVLPGEDAAAAFARALAMLVGDECVFAFAERMDNPFAAEPANPQVVAHRMQAAHLLHTSAPVIVVASARSLARKLPPASAGAAEPLILQVGTDLSQSGEGGDEGEGGGKGKAQSRAQDRVKAKNSNPNTRLLRIGSLADLRLELVRMGYTDTHALEGPGTFAAHGDTIDIFPGNSDFPARLEFFGDELDEIRRILPSTGQTIENLSLIEVYPVTEFSPTPAQLKVAQKKLAQAALTNRAIRELADKLQTGATFPGAELAAQYIYKKQATLGDYVSDAALVCMIEPRAIFDDAQRACEAATVAAQGSGFPADAAFAPPAALSFGAAPRATYVSIMQAGAALDAEIPVKRTDVAGAPEKLYAKVHSWQDAGYTCIFSCPDYRTRTDFELAFVDNNLPIHALDFYAFDEGGEGGEGGEGAAGKAHAKAQGETQSQPAGGLFAHSEKSPSPHPASPAKLLRTAVNITDSPVPIGMVVPSAKLAIVSVDDLKSRKSAAADARRSIDITQITFPYKPGDYVVHSSYGIGLFKDIVRRELDGEMRDYLELDYAEGDKLFLPVEQFDKVTRYVGPEGHTPKITRLDSTDWSRAVAKARKATKKLAFDLVDIYARRAQAKGHRFNVHTPWMRQMEASFPYTETPDQAAAIADVFADMQSTRPMDRLICGDVGFGKTEVALRAAFAAAQDGRQVMVLCPTTILAQQHYTNFVERFAPFGMRVEILSRFRSAAQQKESLRAFAAGEVAVLIGTHRLLSRDVNPHDLGLVIIDEEQRFGVGHKEQFKNMRESIDVLTLSATPIPRTLQMSISGVRDMSLILTPPTNRLPVKVHVGEWDVDVVSAAIRAELARGGQVYYVSNRVRTIEDAVARVVEAAPEARVGMAHGKMSKEALEHVMEDFAAGELDVLVATTIIESGIDNPHTNTLIIEDSQRLGLAQMYQLKGRVGRSSKQAYAYFMFPPDMPLTEDAHERLLALADNQDLGSGMRIAMRDLEIRGAGNLVGAEQSGNVSAVGFDLFAQMLNNAVADARAQIAGATNKAQGGEGEGGEGGGDVSASRGIRDLSDIVVNIPGSAYLADEYIPRIDERVLWYRRIASIYTIAQADDFEAQIQNEYGPLPPEAKTLFDKARIKALASEHNIETITVAAGKLTIEPIILDREQLPSLKREGGRYLADKRKVIMPMKYFAAQVPPAPQGGRPGAPAVPELNEKGAAARERAARRRAARREKLSGKDLTDAKLKELNQVNAQHPTPSAPESAAPSPSTKEGMTTKITQFLSALLEDGF